MPFIILERAPELVLSLGIPLIDGFVTQLCILRVAESRALIFSKDGIEFALRGIVALVRSFTEPLRSLRVTLLHATS